MDKLKRSHVQFCQKYIENFSFVHFVSTDTSIELNKNMKHPLCHKN